MGRGVSGWYGSVLQKLVFVCMLEGTGELFNICDNCHTFLVFLAHLMKKKGLLVNGMNTELKSCLRVSENCTQQRSRGKCSMMHLAWVSSVDCSVTVDCISCRRCFDSVRTQDLHCFLRSSIPRVPKSQTRIVRTLRKCFQRSRPPERHVFPDPSVVNHFDAPFRFHSLGLYARRSGGVWWGNGI